MSTKEKERAKDLSIVSEYCEELANELLTIASQDYNAALLLKVANLMTPTFIGSHGRRFQGTI